MKKVTKRQAEQVLAEVKRVFSPFVEDGNEPVLHMDWSHHHIGPVIAWEGGPYEWAFYFGHGGRTEEFGWVAPEAKLPAGVWKEALYSWAIILHPQ